MHSLLHKMHMIKFQKQLLWTLLDAMNRSWKAVLQKQVGLNGELFINQSNGIILRQKGYKQSTDLLTGLLKYSGPQSR